jgi:glycine cleavage system H protein
MHEGVVIMEFPSDLLYTKHDEWVRVEGDEVVIGITDYAQDQLSDVVYVELPEVGDSFDKGEPFGVVESVKAASDVFMPVTGEITAINEELEDSPEIVNEDPYGKGWFIRIRLSYKSDLDDLMDAEAYQAQLEE